MSRVELKKTKKSDFLQKYGKSTDYFNEAMNVDIWDDFDSKILNVIHHKSNDLGLGEAIFPEEELLTWVNKDKHLKSHAFTFDEVVSHIHLLCDYFGLNIYNETIYPKFDPYQDNVPNNLLTIKNQEEKHVVHIDWYQYQH